MEFEEAKQSFESAFCEAEPCMHTAEGLLIGDTTKGIEVCCRKSSNEAFEAFTRKVGSADGPMAFHSAKLALLTKQSLVDLAKSMAHLGHSIVFGGSNEQPS